MGCVLPELPGFDAARAVKDSGCTPDDYMDTLCMYYRVIDKKYSEIEEAYTSNDIKNYTIYVHALKSASRIVGAYDFAAKAYHLELSGKENDLAEIADKTPEFLNEYRKIQSLIEPYIVSKNGAETIDRMDLIFLLQDLRDYLADNDIVLIEDCMEQLKDCYYNDEVSDLTEQLISLTDESENSQCVDLINDFLEKFTEA